MISARQAVALPMRGCQTVCRQMPWRPLNLRAWSCCICTPSLKLEKTWDLLNDIKNSQDLLNHESFIYDESRAEPNYGFPVLSYRQHLLMVRIDPPPSSRTLSRWFFKGCGSVTVHIQRFWDDHRWTQMIWSHYIVHDGWWWFMYVHVEHESDLVFESFANHWGGGRRNLVGCQYPGCRLWQAGFETCITPKPFPNAVLYNCAFLWHVSFASLWLTRLDPLSILAVVAMMMKIWGRWDDERLPWCMTECQAFFPNLSRSLRCYGFAVNREIELESSTWPEPDTEKLLKIGLSRTTI